MDLKQFLRILLLLLPATSLITAAEMTFAEMTFAARDHGYDNRPILEVTYGRGLSKVASWPPPPLKNPERTSPFSNINRCSDEEARMLSHMAMMGSELPPYVHPLEGPTRYDPFRESMASAHYHVKRRSTLKPAHTLPRITPTVTDFQRRCLAALTTLQELNAPTRHNNSSVATTELAVLFSMLKELEQSIEDRLEARATKKRPARAIRFNDCPAVRKTYSHSKYPNKSYHPLLYTSNKNYLNQRRKEAIAEGRTFNPADGSEDEEEEDTSTASNESDGSIEFSA